MTLKSLVKTLAAALANLTFRLRGVRLPAYFDARDRIFLVLHGFELDMVNAARMFLKPGMVVLDVGANVGLLARSFARAVGKTGRVISFEPDPFTMEFLRYNVRSLPQVELQPIALAEANTVAKLRLHPRSGMSNSLVATPVARQSVDVVCKTLDTFLSESGHLTPDFIKIDVEGAEPRVFAGMKETLARCPNALIAVEFCPKNLAHASCSTQQFYEVLIKSGLQISVLQRSGPPVEVRSHDELIERLETKGYLNLLCRQISTVNLSR